MLTLIAAALAAAQTPAPAAIPHAQHAPTGQMDHSKMDHSKMDHSKMDHSKMDHAKMGQHADGCCKKGPDGKMECTMSNKAGAQPDHQGHSGH